MDSSFLTSRYLMKEGEIGRVITDSPVAIRLVSNLDDNAGMTVTSITVDATTIVTVTVQDTVITTKTYTFADYDNMGELVDAINADHLFLARILDCLRQDTIVGLKAGVLTANTNYGFYDINLATATSKSFSYRLCSGRNVAKQPLSIALDIGIKAHRVHFYQAEYKIDLGAAGAENLQVWRCKYDDKARTYTEISAYTRESVDNTLTTIKFSNGFIPLSSRDGEELLIRIVDGTSLADNAANYMEVSGIIE